MSKNSTTRCRNTGPRERMRTRMSFEITEATTTIRTSKISEAAHAC